MYNMINLKNNYLGSEKHTKTINYFQIYTINTQLIFNSFQTKKNVVHLFSISVQHVKNLNLNNKNKKLTFAV